MEFNAFYTFSTLFYASSFHIFKNGKFPRVRPRNFNRSRKRLSVVSKTIRFSRLESGPCVTRMEIKIRVKVRRFERREKERREKKFVFYYAPRKKNQFKWRKILGNLIRGIKQSCKYERNIYIYIYIR